MDELISREAAIYAIDKIFPVDPMRNDYTQGITCGAALATEYIKQLPSAHPELDEWCTDCKEYDHDKHCCPRWNRVIRQTLKGTQPKKGKWVDEMGNRKTSGYCATCTACGEWSEYITDYCPNCGAHMVEGEDGDENG